MDEKWFVASKYKRKLKLPKGTRKIKRAVHSKTHLQKILYITAIAKPTEDPPFDGKVGIWRCAITVKAKKCSKSKVRGNRYLKDVSLNKARFKHFLLSKVAKAIRQKLPQARKVVQQMDNAPPHGNTEELNELLNTARRAGSKS